MQCDRFAKALVCIGTMVATRVIAIDVKLSAENEVSPLDIGTGWSFQNTTMNGHCMELKTHKLLWSGHLLKFNHPLLGEQKVYCFVYSQIFHCIRASINEGNLLYLTTIKWNSLYLCETKCYNVNSTDTSLNNCKHIMVLLHSYICTVFYACQVYFCLAWPGYARPHFFFPSHTAVLQHSHFN